MDISSKAQGKVVELMKDSELYINNLPVFLRIAVSAGGCSGLKYQTYFDYTELPDDNILEFEGFALHIDKLSGPYLDGASMDYVESMDKIGFTIDNPNAHDGCACGDSFN